MPHHLHSLAPFALSLLATAVALPAQLGGTYVVGPGGSYPNVAAAIAALGTGVVAPVTFLVTANDVGPWTIPAFPGQGPSNPVVFDGGGTTTISGAQPVLTLNGCASVTIRGFQGTFTNTVSSFVVAGATADCVFSGCTFFANVATTGAALFHFTGGAGCRIEDCSFGGAYESLRSDVANSGTIVQRCRIRSGGFRIMTIGGSDFVLVNNFITGTANFGINAGIPGTPTSAPNLKIWHNSVFIAHPTAGSQYCSLRWYTSAAGTEVIDNIFFDSFPTGSPTTYNLWCSGTLRPQLMDFNCFWSDQSAYSPVWASSALTLAGWQALGFDANSIQADPLFVAPTATVPDLMLQTSSPCSDAGDLIVQVPALTDFFQAGRSVPVSIGAHEQDGGIVASYAVFGAGCAGTAGVPSNSASAPPRLGQNSVITFGNLAVPYLAFAIVGVSNTVSAFGPLPIDLAVLGAPGCQARVSLDVMAALTGALGSASFALAVPNQMSLLGFTFHTQALALDPSFNPFGMSISDAATGVVGF